MLVKEDISKPTRKNDDQESSKFKIQWKHFKRLRNKRKRTANILIENIFNIFYCKLIGPLDSHSCRHSLNIAKWNWSRLIGLAVCSHDDFIDPSIERSHLLEDCRCRVTCNSSSQNSSEDFIAVKSRAEITSTWSLSGDSCHTHLCVKETICMNISDTSASVAIELVESERSLTSTEVDSCISSPAECNDLTLNI